MTALTLITGGVFGWIFGAMLMACIVINSERQDRKRANFYRHTICTLRTMVYATDYFPEREKIEAVIEEAYNHEKN